MGKATGWAMNTPVLEAAEATFTGENEQDWSGYAVRFAGDIDRDGHDEFMISAPYFGSSYTGKVYLFYGGGPVIGDLNADRIADIADAIIGLQMISGLEPSVVFENGGDETATAPSAWRK
jgi:hypothetical protein